MKALQAVERAQEKRASLVERLAKEGTTAYRVFSGDTEKVPGLVIDRYDSVLCFQLYEGRCDLQEAELKEIGEWLKSHLSITSVYLKRFVADRTQTVAGKEYYSREPLVGEPSPETISVTEWGRKFLIKPYEGFSTGIFLDQRENRRLLSEGVSGKRVLNTFAYTCAFSVGCALGGAEVTSVDLSRKYLEWGRENFLANGIIGDHRFLAQDAVGYFAKALKRGERFDRVIVDPPSFSRSKEGGVFSLRKDFKRLLRAAEAIVAPGGDLFFSCNLSEMSEGQLRQAVEGKMKKLPPAPADFEGSSQLSAIFYGVN